MASSRTSTLRLKGSSKLPRASSEGSSSYPEAIRALLSIKPDYARAIVTGIKKYEYRRQIFARPVRTVVIYATKPIGMAIGEFDVGKVLYDDLDRLWSSTSKHSGINEKVFREYFTGKCRGYAIKVERFRRYARPYRIESVLGLHPPQSFLYLT